VRLKYKCLGRKARHTCVIETQQYRRMESSSASAPPAREPETIEAAGRVAEQETKALDPLRAPKVRGERETNAPGPRVKSMRKGAWETNMPERETAAIRRDGEPLTSAVQERRLEEAAAKKHQAAAGEQPPPSAREEARLVTSQETDPKIGSCDLVGTDGRTPAQNGRKQPG
jgi:hypothetical protein